MSEMEMTPGIDAAGTELATPPLTQGQRVVDTFIAPSKTFTDIRRNASWWLPYVIGALFIYLFIFAMQSRVGWPKVTENGMKATPKQAQQYAGMTPAQRGVAEKFTMGIWYAVPVLSLAVGAIIALVLWGTINFGFGGQATYGQVFAVWMYAGLPLVLKWLLATVTLFAGLDSDSFNPRNPVGTNLGYYLSPEMPKWLISLGTSMDVFMIWSFVLAGIGLAIVARVKRSSGMIAIFGWWILILLVGAGYAAVAG
ncbi:MAG TPA: YIP1 family protein [Acidisarcina sp.]